VIGYTFTGLNNLKLFFILHGEKDTGKSLLIHLLSAVLGEFSGSTNERVFKESRSEAAHDTAVFSLIGKRVNHVGELKKGDKFNEELLKRVTGGDSLNIRKAGSNDNVDTTPKTVLFLATNGIPKFEDEAFSKRMRVFTFPNKFATNNPKFAHKLLSSVDNFFSVFCMYAKMFNDIGLDDVVEVMASTNEVIASTLIDPFVFFKKSLDACDIEITSVEADTIKKVDLYSSFLEFLHSEGIKNTLGRNYFYEEVLKWEGIKDGRENNLRVFTGIKKIEEKYSQSTSSYPPI
jgi:putative DNA primase/helicase